MCDVCDPYRLLVNVQPLCARYISFRSLYVRQPVLSSSLSYMCGHPPRAVAALIESYVGLLDIWHQIQLIYPTPVVGLTRSSCTRAIFTWRVRVWRKNYQDATRRQTRTMIADNSCFLSVNSFYTLLTANTRLFFSYNVRRVLYSSVVWYIGWSTQTHLFGTGVTLNRTVLVGFELMNFRTWHGK